jgi:hypothetical protein
MPHTCRMQTACTWHKCCKHTACARHARLYRAHACRTHTTFHVLHTPHACDIPPAHTKHAIHISQTCLMHTAHALHTCHSLAIGRLNTFQMHTFMHAQAYCMQEPHKLAAHTHAHTMYACSTQTTLEQHTCHTHLHQRCHICYMRKYAAGMPKTHCVHVACKLHVIYACMHSTLILHILQAH